MQYANKDVPHTYEVIQMTTWAAFVTINWFVTGDRIVADNPALCKNVISVA